jgi:hypothetical protein
MQPFWAMIAQAAYMSMFLGLLGRNVDLLRKCFFIGSILAVTYAIGAGEGPLWVPLFWHATFVVLNAVHLVFTFARKRMETLDGIEVFLKRTAFATFPPDQLKSFLRMGMEGTAPKGQALVNSEAPEREVVCLLKGSAKIMENGFCLGEIKPGHLVGVLSYVCGYAGADVVAASELKVIVWTGGAIDQWVGTDPTRLALIQGVLGAQLVEYLVNEREARRKLAAEQGGVAV